MAGIPWTADEERQIAEYRRRGMTLADIAHLMPNRSRDSLKRKSQKLGLPGASGINKRDSKRVRVTAVLAGYDRKPCPSNQTIANKVRLLPNTVREIIRLAVRAGRLHIDYSPDKTQRRLAADGWQTDWGVIVDEAVFNNIVSFEQEQRELDARRTDRDPCGYCGVRGDRAQDYGCRVCKQARAA